MNKKIKWGIMGTGAIANRFVRSIGSLEDAVTAAVGSRSADKAAEFSARYGIGRSYGNYEELAGDKDIDIIYVATPHSAHFNCSMMCLKAGKPVLCEKPFTINAEEAEKLINEARHSGLFLMEAMWTRFLPAIVRLRELLDNGAVGDVRMLKADFGFRADYNPEGRLFDLYRGGGALLDVGVYPISFSSMIFGARPTAITSLAYLGKSGVDEQCSVLLRYEGGSLSSMSAAIRTQLPDDACILGTEGHIRIPKFWMASSLELVTDGKSQIYNIPFRSTGFVHEAEEAMECLREGRIESGIMPLDESLAVMKIMDAVRKQWGLEYPGE